MPGVILYKNGADVLVKTENEQSLAQRVKAFIKGEVVLTVAVVLALLSAIAVPPDAEYAGYIDWDTLALLFSLMAVTKGLQMLGLFDAWARPCCAAPPPRGGWCWRWWLSPSFSACSSPTTFPSLPLCPSP